MELEQELQNTLFNKIRDLTPSNISMVEEVSAILNISTDSAYRRIRCEKQLDLPEFMALCRQYLISADELFNTGLSKVSFNFYRLNEKEFSFEQYFERIYSDLNDLCKQGNPNIYLIFNELNIFQILQIPILAAFKFFFWSKSNFGFNNYIESQFFVGHVNKSIESLCEKIVELYLQVPTVELISTEVLTSMLKQLNFYYVSGFFKSRDDVYLICDSMLELLNHLQLQAELGFKFGYGQNPVGHEGNYQLYLNDLVMVDNTVIASSDKSMSSYITNNVVNLLVNNNKEYCMHNLNWAKNLIRNSVLISGTAERGRNQYFNRMVNQIKLFKEKGLYTR